MKHITFGIAVALMLMLSVSAFGAGRPESAVPAETASLNAFLMGPGRQRDSQMVWEAFNAKLGTYLPGTSIDIEVITASDFRERWQLTMAANERVDIAWRGWVMNLDDEVNKGAYLPLDDLVADHAPGIIAELPRWVLDMGRVDGTLYEIPLYQQMANRWAIWTDRKLAEQYLDIDAFQEALWSSDVVTDEWLDIIEDYLRKLKAAGELRLGIHVPWFEARGYEIFANPYAYRLDDPDMEVVYIWDTPRHLATLDRLHVWYNDGLIRQDVISIRNLGQDDFRPDGHVMWMDQVFMGSEQARSADRGFEMIAFTFEPHYSIGSGRSPTNITIPRTARHPEKAAQVIELLNTRRGTDLYNTLVYGLEDVHYTRVSDDRVETLHYVGSPTGDSPYGIPKWALGNTFNAYLTQAEKDGWNEYIEDVVHRDARVSPLMGFSLDRRPVEDELAMVMAVRGEYHSPFRMYALPNYREVHTESIEKLRLAGHEKVVAEFQRQIDEFRARQRRASQ